MTEDKIVLIFLQIAFRAMDTGKDLILEKGKNKSTSTLFGGALQNSESDYDSLTMTITNPETEEEEEEEGEAE